MAYNGKHLAKLDDLKHWAPSRKRLLMLWRRVLILWRMLLSANVLEGVKVNGTALSIANKMVDILIATGSKNGSISVNGADVAIKGLAALAFKAKVSQSDLDEALAAILEGKADKQLLWTVTALPMPTPRMRSTPRSALSISLLALWPLLNCPLCLRAFWVMFTMSPMPSPLPQTSLRARATNIPRAPMLWWSRSRCLQVRCAGRFR